jgi:hypothetical protein
MTLKSNVLLGLSFVVLCRLASASGAVSVSSLVVFNTDTRTVFQTLQSGRALTLKGLPAHYQIRAVPAESVVSVEVTNNGAKPKNIIATPYIVCGNVSATACSFTGSTYSISVYSVTSGSANSSCD